MTNSHNRMVTKGTATPGRKFPRQRSPSTTYFNSIATPPRKSFSNGMSEASLDQSRFASSKWGEAPAPAALPKPPRHWISKMFPSSFTTLLFNVQA